MRREKESWKRVECIQEEKQIAEMTNKYSRLYKPYHCCSYPLFMHRIYTFRSDCAVAIERRERAVICPRKVILLLLYPLLDKLYTAV